MVYKPYITGANFILVSKSDNKLVLRSGVCEVSWITNSKLQRQTMQSYAHGLHGVFELLCQGQMVLKRLDTLVHLVSKVAPPLAVYNACRSIYGVKH